MDPAWEAETVAVEDEEYDDNGFPPDQVPEESVEDQISLPLESIKGCNDRDQEDCLSLKEEEFEDEEDNNGINWSFKSEDGSNATELQTSTQEKQEDSGGTPQDFREPDNSSKLDERQSASTSYGDDVSPAVERQNEVFCGADQGGDCGAERPITCTSESSNQDDTNQKYVMVEGTVDAVNRNVPKRESSFQEDFKDGKFAEKGEAGSRRTRSDESDIRALEKTPDDGREKLTALPDTEELDPGPSRDDRKGSLDLSHQGSNTRKITRQRDEGPSDVSDRGSSSDDDNNSNNNNNHSTKSAKVPGVSAKFNCLILMVYFSNVAFIRGVAALTVIPEDVLASSGSIGRLRCSTDYPNPVYWERRLFGSDDQETIYYGKNGLARIAGDRISVDEDSTSGRYDLVISNVQLEDAGTYTCIDEAGIGEGYPAELVVSERFTCKMPVPRYGFMGENIFDIPEDPVESTCSLAFRGNVVPRFQWTWGKVTLLVPPTVINGSTVTSSVTLRATHDMNGASLTGLPFVSKGATSPDDSPRWISEPVLVRYVHVMFGSVDECQSSAMIPVCNPNCTYKVQKPSDDKCQCLAVYNDRGTTYKKIFSEYSCEISVWPRNTVIIVVVAIIGTFAIAAAAASTIFAIKFLRRKKRELPKKKQPSEVPVLVKRDVEACFPNEIEDSDSAQNLLKNTCKALHHDEPKSIK